MQAVEADGHSNLPAISADGMAVAFVSYASNLVPGDGNSRRDIFVWDKSSDTISRVSLSTSGVQSGYESLNPAISGDGRFVGFDSRAPNFVVGDTNASSDVFLRDRLTNVTTRISVSASGVQGEAGSTNPSISGDGRYIAFESDANNLVSGDLGSHDIFVKDRVTGTVRLISLTWDGKPANFRCEKPNISNDGRFVAFISSATNLVPIDTNNKQDVFLVDTLLNTITRVSVAGDGSEANDNSIGVSLSSDGSRIAFVSYANNLVPDDTNACADAFVKDIPTGQVTRASVSETGMQLDRSTFSLSLSASGTYLVFWYDSTKTFLRDLRLNSTSPLSVKLNGTTATGIEPAISGDGRYAAFASYDPDIVTGDVIGREDIFVKQLLPAVLVGVKVQPTSIKGGLVASGLVTFSDPAPSGGANILLATSNTGIAQVPSKVTIPSGATVKAFPVTTQGQSVDRIVTITATRAGVVRTTSLTVLRSLLQSLAVSPTTVTGGESSTGQVTLDGAAPSGGANVLLSSSQAEVVTVPSLTNVPKGLTQSVFQITTRPVGSSTDVTIVATRAGIVRTQTVTVVP